MPSFIHLRVHSEYSVSDGLVRVKPLMSHLAETGMPAIAVTDRTNFYALIKLYKAAQAAGIKFIIGADVSVRDEDDPDASSVLCLLAMNESGYRNMTELLSKAFLEGQRHGIPYVTQDWIREHSDGVIALSGAADGDVGQALVNGRAEVAEERLAKWMSIFPDRYYLEVHRTGRQYDEDQLHAAAALGVAKACPVVATNNVRFLKPEDFEAHEARVCIHEGRTLDDSRRVRLYTQQQYLRTEEEMLELFSDFPEALENSIEIAKRCNVTMHLGEPHLPDYPIPDNLGLEQFFRQRCHQGLDDRLQSLFDPNEASTAETVKKYRARLDFEIDVILQMGFPGYFLIVMDFIQWARDNGIPVGPGRGSGAGSLVAYALMITDLDPLEYDLLFERFLNPDRVSMPDFDIDFCMERRDEVISYVADNYGRDAVSQIITFGTMAAKAVVRDVARAQGKSYGLADRLSKMIPFEVGMTLEKAVEQEEPLREFLAEDGQAQEIWDMAEQLEGVIRNVGKHAGGVVIAPSKLTDFSALVCDEDGAGLVTQFDKSDVEEAGLVKFDFLGLRTLTIIDWALKMINQRANATGADTLAIEQIPLTDEDSFALLRRAETTAVFQLESRGMKDLIKRLQPDCFEDIIALVALFRPGPLQSGMVDNFINRKHGRESLAYPDAQYQHEWLKPILEPTYGIILYQEQVMQIAQVLAGYTLGGADLLRRAMGKKNADEMAKQRAIFEQGAATQGVDPELAIKIFDLVEKFAGYGFNKSHSAAYALVSYHTAWLKTHYPSPFMAAVMSSELHNTDKIVVMIEECRAMNLPLKLPDVNEGQYLFSVTDDDEIVYGLGAIKGLGEGPSESILAAREGGLFTSLFDFCERTDARKVNKRALEALIRSGAFDNLGEDRAILMASMPAAVQSAEQSAHNRASGVVDMFGDLTVDVATGDPYTDFRSVKPMSSRERLNGERDTLGLYVTGHPLDEHTAEIRRYAKKRIIDIRPDGNNKQKIAGLVVGVRTIKTKRGDTMAIVQLDDCSAVMEVTAFADIFTEYRELLVKDKILIAEGSVNNDEYSGGISMRADSFCTLLNTRQNQIKELTISVSQELVDNDFAEQLEQLLSVGRGGNCPVTLLYSQVRNKARVQLGAAWQVNPSDELIECLRDKFGEESVSLAYGNQ
ncbi:MAG: DNA polymerase-3 subunit alpha [Halieaceae bacterium]|jgi:DNA polymerase-3 subunit alpha